MSGFDQNYYSNHLSAIYEGSTSGANGTLPVYNVDTKLFNLRNYEETNRTVDLSAYFKDISTLGFRSEDPDALRVRASMNEDTFNLATGTYIAETTPVPGVFERLSGKPSKEIVSVLLSRATNMIQPLALLDAINADTAQYNDSATQSHKKMNQLFRAMHTSIGKVFFKRVMEVIRSDSSVVPNAANKWIESKYIFSHLTDSQTNKLIDETRDFAYNSLRDIVRTKATDILEYNSQNSTKKYIPTSYLNDLVVGVFKGPLYCKLKKSMLETFKTPGGMQYDDDNINLYLKMLAVDIYIKTCTPVLIYDYISIMMELYTEYGDFVNARIALLAKTMFTYHVYKTIVDAYTTLSNVDNTTYNQQITTVINKFNFYLSYINRDAEKLPNIIIDLHQRSNDVVDKNKTIMMLKEQIRRNQLAMRNVIYNTDELNKQYLNKKIEVVTLVVILLALIVASSVLMFLGMNQWVLYVAGIIAIAILVFEVTKIISNIIKSTKKSS